jgi:hypothetical protein
MYKITATHVTNINKTKEKNMNNKTPQSITAGSWGRHVFNFKQNYQTNFQSGYIILYSN